MHRTQAPSIRHRYISTENKDTYMLVKYNVLLSGIKHFIDYTVSEADNKFQLCLTETQS